MAGKEKQASFITQGIILAAASVIHSKTFDNGMICASEQAVVVAKEVYAEFKAELTAQGCYFVSEEEADKLRELLFGTGVLN